MDLDKLAKQRAKEILEEKGVEVACPFCHEKFVARAMHTECPNCHKTLDVKFEL